MNRGACCAPNALSSKKSAELGFLGIAAFVRDFADAKASETTLQWLEW